MDTKVNDVGIVWDTELLVGSGIPVLLETEYLNPSLADVLYYEYPLNEVRFWRECYDYRDTHSKGNILYCREIAKHILTKYMFPETPTSINFPDGTVEYAEEQISNGNFTGDLFDSAWQSVENGFAEYPYPHFSEHIHIHLKESWGKLVANGSAPVIGQLLFAEFFRLDPDARKYFPPDITEHCVMFSSVIAYTVSAVEDLQKITGSLDRCGKRHQKYSIASHHFALLGVAVMNTFKLGMGDNVTYMQTKAWKSVYMVLTGIMANGLTRENELQTRRSVKECKSNSKRRISLKGDCAIQ